MSKFIPVCILLAMTIPLLSGCGGNSAAVSTPSNLKGEQLKIAATIESLQQASEGVQGKKLCSELFAKSLVREVESGGAKCASKVDKSLRDADDFTVDVLSIKVSGKTAKAQVRRKGDQSAPVSTFNFAKQDGKWRLAVMAV